MALDRSRLFSSRRTAITDSLVALFKSIDGTGEFVSNISGQVFNKLKYMEDLNDFPAISVIAGSENRTYQTAQYRDRFLNCRIVVFVNEETPLTKLDSVLEDLETLIEANGRLAYIDKQGATQYTHDIKILNISTDEGALEPIAIGEMSILVHY
jgi:hypothetical protein